MNSNNNLNDEEVALGQFFQMLVAFIKWIFNSIFHFFKSVFVIALDGLTFLRKYWLANLIGIIIGGVLGYFISKSGGEVYQSNLVVKTNFESGKQLYDQVDYINSLIIGKKYNSIVSEFSINEEDALKLRKIEIEPISTDIENAIAYKTYLNEVDTNFYKPIGYQKYITSIEPTSYRFHQIEVSHLENINAENLNKGLTNKIANNSFFELRQVEKTNRINDEISKIDKEFADLDSLKKALNQALKSQKNNSSSDAVLSISQKRESPDLSWVYSKSLQLQNLKNELNEDKIELTKIIEIVTPLQEVGIKVSPLKTIAKFVLLGLMLAVFIISSIKLNAFLVSRNS
jgi:hypothetical protein